MLVVALGSQPLVVALGSQEFFPYSIDYIKIVDFEAFLGPVRLSPRKTSKNSCASHDFQSKTKALATGLLT